MNLNWQLVYFPLKRVVRQGCLVSALLFLIVVEFLAIDLNRSIDVKGINLPGKANEVVEVKISQFAEVTKAKLQKSL